MRHDRSHAEIALIGFVVTLHGPCPAPIAAAEGRYAQHGLHSNQHDQAARLDVVPQEAVVGLSQVGEHAHAAPTKTLKYGLPRAFAVFTCSGVDMVATKSAHSKWP